ncbi:MAG: hypothetical protein FD144_4234 [Rhodospirillaceae bacterium]|nr:MAG: hypothetical protein FD144_4234 [Rhodospirillaceae bacterium]
MADDSGAYVPLTPEERQEALKKLWDAMVTRLLEALQGDQPTRASMLDVSRKFLADQGFNAVSRPDLRRGLEAMAELRNLPFDPDGNKH